MDTGNQDIGQILYTRHRDVVVIKFIGLIGYTSRWTFPLSSALSAFIERLCDQRDFQNVVIDLTEATGIDSTNLGLLAQIAQFMASAFERKAVIVTSNKAVTKTLRAVGFHTLFTIIDEHAPIIGGLEPVPAVVESESNVARMILEAHKTLADLNPHNRLLFKNIIEAIEEDIASRQSDVAPRPASS